MSTFNKIIAKGFIGPNTDQSQTDSWEDRC